MQPRGDGALPVAQRASPSAAPLVSHPDVSQLAIYFLFFWLFQTISGNVTS